MMFSDGPRRLVVAAFVSTLSFAAYWLTHGPGPYWQDAGLFVAGLKARGGLAPPGYPVYLLLGRPFVAVFEALLPHRAFAEAVNTFSSLWAALAAGLTALSIGLLLTPGYSFFARPAAPAASRRTPATTAPDAPAGALSSLALFAMALGGLLAGLSYSLWFQAITAEAYALNAFFAAWVLYLFLRLGAEGPLGRSPSARQRRLAVLLFVVHGLSCGNHPSTVMFVPVLAYFVWTQREALQDRRIVGAVFVAYGASGLLPYLYLPWAAWHYPTTLYNHVTTVDGLMGHVTGSQWTASSESYGWSFDRVWEFPLQVWQELFVAGLAGLFLGARRLGREQPGLLTFLASFGAPAWLLPMFYLQGGEYDFWLLPLYMCFFIVAGAGIHSLLERAAAWSARPAWRGVLAALVALLALGPPLAVNIPLVDRHDDHVPDDFARNLYRHVAPGALLFASSDQECSLTYYLQVVEGHRPDVVRVDAPALALPWYVPYLRKRYPDLVVPDAPRTAGGGAVTSDDWLAEILLANRDRRTIYISKRPRLPQTAAPVSWIPAGGLWKTGPQAGTTIDRTDWEYEYRNPRPFDRPGRNHAPQKVTSAETGEALGLARVRREPYAHQIRRFHLQAWKNLGDWSLEHEQFQEAADAYTKLFAMDPSLDHPGLLFAMGKTFFALNRNQEALKYFDRLSGRLDPQASAELMLYVGQIHASEGRRDAAAEYFRAARRLAPELWRQYEPALRAKGFVAEGGP